MFLCMQIYLLITEIVSLWYHDLVKKANQITSKKICTNILIKRIRYEMLHINLYCQYLRDFYSLKVGHNRGDEFTFHWWDHVFNKAASSIVVESTQVWYSTILYVYMYLYKTCVRQVYFL